jgi:hypothetical protein
VNRRSRGGNHAIPFWDSERRELRVGDIVAKRFRQPARNQEIVLAAFQEEGWPPRIDNPLPGNGDTSEQDRLHDAVRRLNQQANRMIRFECDGRSEGIVWSLV